MPPFSDHLHDPSLQEEQPGCKGIRPVMRTEVSIFTMKWIKYAYNIPAPVCNLVRDTMDQGKRENASILQFSCVLTVNRTL